MNKLILLVFCHLVGDYVLQNDFIAKNKGSNWYHLDLTWDDPITSNNQDILEYTYFLVDNNKLLTAGNDQHQFDINIYSEFQ